MWGERPRFLKTSVILALCISFCICYAEAGKHAKEEGSTEESSEETDISKTILKTRNNRPADSSEVKSALSKHRTYFGNFKDKINKMFEGAFGETVVKKQSKKGPQQHWNPHNVGGTTGEIEKAFGKKKGDPVKMGSPNIGREGSEKGSEGEEDGNETGNTKRKEKIMTTTMSSEEDEKEMDENITMTPTELDVEREEESGKKIKHKWWMAITEEPDFEFRVKSATEMLWESIGGMTRWAKKKPKKTGGNGEDEEHTTGAPSLKEEGPSGSSPWGGVISSGIGLQNETKGSIPKHWEEGMAKAVGDGSVGNASKGSRLLPAEGGDKVQGNPLLSGRGFQMGKADSSAKEGGKINGKDFPRSGVNDKTANRILHKHVFPDRSGQRVKTTTESSSSSSSSEERSTTAKSRGNYTKSTPQNKRPPASATSGSSSSSSEEESSQSAWETNIEISKGQLRFNTAWRKAGGGATTKTTRRPKKVVNEKKKSDSGSSSSSSSEEDVDVHKFFFKRRGNWKGKKIAKMENEKEVAALNRATNSKAKIPEPPSSSSSSSEETRPVEKTKATTTTTTTQRPKGKKVEESSEESSSEEDSGKKGTKESPITTTGERKLGRETSMEKTKSRQVKGKV